MYDDRTTTTMRLAHIPMHRPIPRRGTIARGLDVPVDGAQLSVERHSCPRIVRLLTWVSAKIVFAKKDIYTELDTSTPFAQRVAQDSMYGDMVKLMEEVPLNDADAWMNEAMNLNPDLAMLLLEARKKSTSKFDYELLSELITEHYERTDEELMAEYVIATGGSTNTSVAGSDGANVVERKPTLRRAPGADIVEQEGEKIRGLQVPASTWEPSVTAEQLGMKQINRLLTWASAKRVIAEIEGGESNKQDPDSAALVKLKGIPLEDADVWMRKAMNLSPSLALRLVKGRQTCASEFDYNLLSQLAQEDIVGADKKLTAKYVSLKGDLSTDDAEAAPTTAAATKAPAAEAPGSQRPQQPSVPAAPAPAVILPDLRYREGDTLEDFLRRNGLNGDEQGSSSKEKEPDQSSERELVPS
eukprot:gnl/TRDRNA2_/TRDRNA2_45172_c0_seq1.p1 gnl/TRDRNA2_/TRDRNA2_45172_c0~~gnl/TRDRNA2_/TRDRNA2_45172_c0_seq1.p1  ORF type:complete len:438 (-),score=71.47 gnl/TRDRNA2_/TRDRNA2_45172_c0_seq1:138-1379(-)